MTTTTLSAGVEAWAKAVIEAKEKAGAHIETPCPKHDGGYDCTPFCSTCEGEQFVKANA